MKIKNFIKDHSNILSFYLGLFLSNSTYTLFDFNKQNIIDWGFSTLIIIVVILILYLYNKSKDVKERLEE